MGAKRDKDVDCERLLVENAELRRRIAELSRQNDELSMRVAELERRRKRLGGKPPTERLNRAFSLKSEERQTEQAGSTRLKRQRSLWRGRVSTLEKLARAGRSDTVLLEGFAIEQCRLVSRRPVWRIENGRAVLVAYENYHGPGGATRSRVRPAVALRVRAGDSDHAGSSDPDRWLVDRRGEFPAALHSRKRIALFRTRFQTCNCIKSSEGLIADAVNWDAVLRWEESACIKPICRRRSSRCRPRDACDNTPACDQSCNLRQQVAGEGRCFGSPFHWDPVRRIQRMPSRQDRGGTRGRPPARPGTNHRNKSSITAQCSSVSSETGVHPERHAELSQ